MRFSAEAQQFADTLKADKIIVHPGINGDIQEASRQLRLIADPRILIENMPPDGDWQGVLDQQLHFREGNFKIKKILKLLPPNSRITIETVRDFKDNLNDFKKDVETLKDLLI